MSTFDIRLDYQDQRGRNQTRVLVSAVTQESAHEMLGKRWHENSLVSGLFDIICEEIGEADVYICQTSEPLGGGDE